VLVGLIFSQCRKDDNPKLPKIERVSVPLLIKNETDGDFLIQDPEIFKAVFTTDLYFKDGAKPKSYDVVIAFNGDYSNVKVYKANVTSFPSQFSITGPELYSLFGKTIANDFKVGDYFEIGANIVSESDLSVPAFNKTGSAYGSDIINLPGSSPTIIYRAVCPLDINQFVGDFTVDDPDFWEASYPVQISLEGTDILVVKGWVEDPAAEVKITVDLKKQLVTVPKQIYTPSIAGLPYTNYTIVGAGNIDPCTTSISFTAANAVDQGSFGNASISIHK